MKAYVLTWVALIVLAIVSFVLSFFHLGGWTVPVAFAIAAIKGALVVVFFMHLPKTSSSIRLASLLCVTLFGAMLVLISVDEAARGAAPLLPFEGGGER